MTKRRIIHILFGLCLLAGRVIAQTTDGQTTPPSTLEGGSMGWMLVKTLLTLGVVVGLVAAVVWVVKRLAVSGRAGGPVPVRVSGTTYLAPKKAIYLVDVAGRRLVLGVTDQSIQLLTELPIPEEEALDASKPQPGFKQKLRGSHE